MTLTGRLNSFAMDKVGWRVFVHWRRCVVLDRSMRETVYLTNFFKEDTCTYKFIKNASVKERFLNRNAQNNQRKGGPVLLL